MSIVSWKNCGHMEGGETRIAGAILASKEMDLPIISMTVCWWCVYSGAVHGRHCGRLLHEFSVTIALAILISGVVSLTPDSHVGSRFLRVDHDARHGWLFYLFERGFGLLTSAYESTLRCALRFKLATVGLAVLLLVGTVCYSRECRPASSQPGQRLLLCFHAAGQDISYESMALIRCGQRYRAARS